MPDTTEPVTAGDDILLNDALREQCETLFNAAAIITACADGIEQRFGDEIDSADSGAPAFPRALMEAARMIDRACGGLELVCLRDRAEEIRKEQEEEET